MSEQDTRGDLEVRVHSLLTWLEDCHGYVTSIVGPDTHPETARPELVGCMPVTECLIERVQELCKRLHALHKLVGRLY